MRPSKSSADRFQHFWRRRGLAAWLLLPVGWLFFLIAAVRRLAYRIGVLRAECLTVPVVVIGNIIAGGAGKTPLTLWLAQRLRAEGRRPGIVSRGYGRIGTAIGEVGPDATARAVGDEPLLMARRSTCPVFVGADRAAAGRALLADHPECDVILCDDGLQHYRLHRDVEIAVVDRRGLMNGWPLPAGPLREPPGRLARIDALVLNGLDQPPVKFHPVFRMQLMGAIFHRLGDPVQRRTAGDFAGQRLHAVAGIGEPQRFFDHLDRLGLSCECHAFADHHEYVAADLNFVGDAILMTEKDAIKCVGLGTVPIWLLPVDAVLEPDLARHVLDLLDLLEKPTHGSATA